MRGVLFRNRWFALLYAAIVLVGVARIVGTGNGDGAVDLAKRQIVERKAERAPPATVREARRLPVKVQFLPDEDLIDPATGEDPTPIDQRAGGEESADDEVPHDTVIILSHDASEGPPPPTF